MGFFVWSKPKRGPVYGGSTRAKKAQLRSSRGAHFQHATFHPGTYYLEKPQEEIIFDEEDPSPEARGGECPTTPLVTPVVVANYWVKRALVDIGSPMDIISYNAFRWIGFEDSSLTEVTTTLQDLGQQKILILREAMFPLSLGSYPNRVTKMARFAVFNATLQYNLILVFPSLNAFGAIATVHHQKLKFPTPEGI
ncbi:hypothetical protein DH2020_029111 [Rehmannia glutinosa]|uniref:Uncharacterized protein n=1 Tax=Rehmannia glutinosa TaxID=99300 RepID=A0ABR0VPH9_REHGL